MAQLQWRCSYCIILICLLALLNATATSVSPWEPDFVTVDPVSPVIYNFDGSNDRICISLSPSVTVVVTKTISDSSSSYLVDRPPHVDIDLVQTRRACYHDAAEMCILLVVTTTSSNLTEGVFNIYYKNLTTELAHGPLGFSNPNGNGNHVVIFTNNTARLLYRRAGHDSTANLANTGSSVPFTVCSNDGMSVFEASPFPVANCRVGTGAGGFSVPSTITIVYVGSRPINRLQSWIVPSEDCTAAPTATSYYFVALDAGLFTPATTPPAPMTTPPAPITTPTSPLSATITSPNDTKSPYTTVIAIAVPATFLALLVIVFISGGLAVCYYRKRRKYDVNERRRAPPAPEEHQGIPPAPEEHQGIPPAPEEHQGIPPAPEEHHGVPKPVNRNVQDEVDHHEIPTTSVSAITTEQHRGQSYNDDQDTLPQNPTTPASHPQSSVHLTHTPASAMQYPHTVPVVRRENSVTESTTINSVAKTDPECTSHDCCQNSIRKDLSCLTQSVETMLQNQGKMISNQGRMGNNQKTMLGNQHTMINNGFQQELAEQNLDPELTESQNAR